MCASKVEIQAWYNHGNENYFYFEEPALDGYKFTFQVVYSLIEKKAVSCTCGDFETAGIDCVHAAEVNRLSQLDPKHESFRQKPKKKTEF